VERKVADCALQPLRLKLVPGSKGIGLALFERVHWGNRISEARTARRQMRCRHRGANLRYRAPRFLNRTRPQGWLAPSLQHRVDTSLAWVTRICRWVPVTALSCELVRFDMAAMHNPDIEGVEYQQDALAGYEPRECLLKNGVASTPTGTPAAWRCRWSTSWQGHEGRLSRGPRCSARQRQLQHPNLWRRRARHWPPALQSAATR
jgi:hypothetical protein